MHTWAYVCKYVSPKGDLTEGAVINSKGHSTGCVEQCGHYFQAFV